MTKRSGFAALVLGLLGLSMWVSGVLAPTSCRAQTLPFLGHVDPERISPRQMRASARAEVEGKESPWLFFANPLVSGSKASWTGETDLGASYSPPQGSKGLPFTLLGFWGSGRAVGDGSSFSYGGSYGDVTLYRNDLLTTKVLGVYAKDTSSRSLGGGASIDFQVGEKLSIGTTALRSNAKEAGETTSTWKYEARARGVVPFFSQAGQLSITPRVTFQEENDFYELGLRLDLPTGFNNRSSAITLSAGNGSFTTIILGWELDWPGK